MIEGVAQDAHVAALPQGGGQHFGRGSFQAFAVVGHDEVQSVQPALLECDDNVLSLSRAFAVGQLHGRHVPAAAPVDTEGRPHGATADDAHFAHPSEARIEDEMGIHFGERPRHDERQRGVDFQGGRGHAARAETVAAAFLGDGVTGSRIRGRFSGKSDESGTSGPLERPRHCLPG